MALAVAALTSAFAQAPDNPPAGMGGRGGSGRGGRGPQTPPRFRPIVR
jgi:hypothetical protein